MIISLCLFLVNGTYYSISLYDSLSFVYVFSTIFKGVLIIQLLIMQDQMIEIKKNSNIEENVEPLTDNQICEIVLGKKSNFVKKMIGT